MKSLSPGHARTAAATIAAAEKRRELRANNPDIRAPHTTTSRLRAFADGFVTGYEIETATPGGPNPFVKGDRFRGFEAGRTEAILNRARGLSDVQATDHLPEAIEKYCRDRLFSEVPDNFTIKAPRRPARQQTAQPRNTAPMDDMPQLKQNHALDKITAATGQKILSDMKAQLTAQIQGMIAPLRRRLDDLSASLAQSSHLPIDPQPMAPLKGAELRAARALLNWTQDELAANAGVSKRFIRLIELDEPVPLKHHQAVAASIHAAHIIVGNSVEAGLNATFSAWVGRKRA